MKAFPAYTWTALNEEDPAFLRAIMIESMGGSRDDEEEVSDDD